MVDKRQLTEDAQNTLIARYREERTLADAEIRQALDAILEKIGGQR